MNSVVRQEDEFDGYDEQGQLEPHRDQSSPRFAHPSVLLMNTNHLNLVWNDFRGGL